ncbi:relaxase domain-containing protein [Antribacter sp. KLBMP9083]|uniref:Relaxase domain-containing protein n=1 Tax=Antribacter soli TaxID=2910976 RepID=A0AA41U782_9MICO|nr:MobF family relaxase [Antribacter soli]MCF4121276.1 relaxase domain-containing protein [Antribacter soli]
MATRAPAVPVWGVTMSIHKLSAGSGYDYLTRQVAAADATDLDMPLADYYAAKGEAPGRWVGSGLGDLDGLEPGDVVTAEQMANLFGDGLHPLSTDENPLRLGAAFRTFSNDRAKEFAEQIVQRMEEANRAAGLPAKAAVDRATVSRIRSQVAAEFFAADHGRSPRDARELAGAVARYARFRTGVAGFDLTFSPVKSVSALWAVAPMPVARRIETAHDKAVAKALAFLEAHAIYTREGANGARQVETGGLVGAAFTHRDSRAGDPDLHTHVAVANKVRTTGGKWLAIYGHVLYEHVVAASEVYNTALERHLADDLGLEFAERPAEPGKRAVREVIGVDEQLCRAWSARRADILARQGELTTEFQATHGRPPTKTEAIGLAQQANLETREAKHEPRSLAEQRATWRAQGDAVLGAGGVEAMVNAAGGRTPAARSGEVTAGWVQEVAARVVAEVEARAAAWQDWHLQAEALRQVRAAATGVNLPAGDLGAVTRVVVDAARSRCVNLTPDLDDISEPEVLRRSDGISVYRHTGADRYTTTRVLDAEQRILASAGRRDGARVDERDVDLVLLEAHANGQGLNDGQRRLVTALATSGSRVQVALAPAGTGKTTAMRALARAWTQAGGRARTGGNVIGLAPSATAAAELREATGMPCDTLAKLVHELDNPRLAGVAPSWAAAIGPEALVLIDEAGMADTLTLDRVIAYVLDRGASVRLVGDDQQLAAIGAGGILRDLTRGHHAARLDVPVRFTDPAEAQASLRLREGDPAALGFYLDNDRIHPVDPATAADTVYRAWATDRAAGLDSIMLAPTRDLVTDLNQRAQADRLAVADGPDGGGVWLADGCTAHAGDVVLTRRNDRRLRVSATDWVKNGDRWTVTAVARDGALTVRRQASGLTTLLPAGYVGEHVQLGYAATVHAAQGATCDTLHGILTGTETRQIAYTMLSRARHANHVYITTAVPDAELAGDVHVPSLFDLDATRTATETLEEVLGRDGSAVSATTTSFDATAPATRLHQAATRYEDAVHAAAEHAVGPDRAAAIERHAAHLLPGLTDEPAWPALHARLLLAEADGNEATSLLSTAIHERELVSADDPAAVLAWRIDRLAPTARGVLPWLPAVPQRLVDDDVWGKYLSARATAVNEHATTVIRDAQARLADVDERPRWADAVVLPDDLATVLAVWRAAMGVPDHDRRPTGPAQTSPPLHAYQRHLDRAVASWQPTSAGRPWIRLAVAATGHHDDHTAKLAEHLADLHATGINPVAAVEHALARGPLPDDHPTAALDARLTSLEQHTRRQVEQRRLAERQQAAPSDHRRRSRDMSHGPSL